MLSHNAWELLGTKRLLPLFLTQFLGAFNDHFFKTALLVLISFTLAKEENSATLITIGGGLFVLPFLLFSIFAGQLADKFEKSRIIQITKIIEIIIMGMGLIGLITQNINLLFTILFFMGSQSAFFSPAKFASLPQLLEKNELVAGNGILEGGVFLAILLGTILGGILININTYGAWIVGGITIILAILGTTTSFFIPKAPATAPALNLKTNPIKEIWDVLKYGANQAIIFYPILAIAWFHLIGATYQIQFPEYVTKTVNGTEYIVSLFLGLLSIGIATGSIICNRMLKEDISLRLMPFATVGIGIFSIDLFFASQHIMIHSEPIGILGFLSYWQNWRIVIDLFLMAFSGGVFVIPLYAWIQYHVHPDHRSRVLGSVSLMNALFVVLMTGITVLLYQLNFTVNQLFLLLGIITVIIGAFITKVLFTETIRGILATLFSLVYRIEVHGVENYPKQADRLLIVCNHVSYIDAPILAVFLPMRPMFAISPVMVERWWVKPWLNLIKTLPLDATKPLATKTLIHKVKEGHHCVIFPEGRLTETGTLMKIYEGTGMVADRAKALVLPIHLEGVENTPFSRLEGRVKRGFFGKIIMTINPPQPLEVAAEFTGRKRRHMAGQQLYNIMSDSRFASRKRSHNLFQSLIQATKKHGYKKEMLEDIDRSPLHYEKICLASLILGKKIKQISQPKEIIGVMLPNAVGHVVTFFGLQAYGIIPAILNFSAGRTNILSACKTAQIKTVLTSKRFIERGQFESLITLLEEEAQVKVVYLENIKAQISLIDKLSGWFRLKLYYWHFLKAPSRSDDPAVVLFTSGSEGVPKGVVLSQDNILANCYQANAHIDFHHRDTVFNALPMFHSFGLTAGTILPVLYGVKIFLYPSPLHYRIVPEMVYTMNATILFGTDTFLNGYARMAHPYDFYSVRYVVAGAEKVKEETRTTWINKFGIRILEGYGATETSPILSLNTPIHFKQGTVGKFLPDIEYHIEKIAGIEQGGRLHVKGPNIMLGYLKADQPGQLQPLEEGWYDTGDIVDIDQEGYITILGRAKRFAKIAGEMISLAAVENFIMQVYPDKQHAIIAIPDVRKGEQLVLITTENTADRKILSHAAGEYHVSELFIPKQIIIQKTLPVLSSGKIDYVTIKTMVEQQQE